MSTNIDKKLETLFNMEPGKLIAINDIPTEVIDDTLDNNASTDYAVIRENIKMMITQASDALSLALEVAKDSEDAKSFDAYTNLLKTISELNIKLLDVTDKMKKINSKRVVKPNEPIGAEAPPQVINNNVFFTGTSDQLNKMIEKALLGNNNVITPDK